MRLTITRFVFSFWQILNRIQGIAADGFHQQSKSTPLYGQHVTVTGLETTVDFVMVRNASGHIIQLRGIAGKMFEWMKSYYNFTYSPLQVKSNVPWDSLDQHEPGLVSYLLKGECDILGSGALTSSRMTLVDFTIPIFYLPISFLVPAPGSTVNVIAAIKPFQLSAWMGTLAAMATVLVTIYFGTWYSVTKLKAKDSGHKPNRSQIAFYVLAVPFAYYCGIEKWLPNRIVIGAWCLSAFILINYYTSLLTGYTTAPNPQPLIKSIEDLRYLPDVRLVTDKDRNVDVLLSAATSGFLKGLGDRLKSDPQSRCLTTQQCAGLVKQGRTVYTSARDTFLMKAIKEDYAMTGKCNFELGKDFMVIRLSWGVRKQSPYQDYLNIGITRLHESGLFALWFKQNNQHAHECLQNRKGHKPEVIAPLQIRSLTGAFVAFIFGFIVSFVMLIFEWIRFHHFSVRTESY